MKLKIYHIDIFCPEWGRNSILFFCKALEGTKLRQSFHAKNKIRSMKRKYRIASKVLVKNIDISNELYLDYVFEFYANKDNLVKKVCYRIPLRELDSDLIIVVSSTGKLVTVYLNNNFDGHHNLKEGLYEKKEKTI